MKKGAIRQDASGERAPGEEPTAGRSTAGAEEDDSTVTGETGGEEVERVPTPREAAMQRAVERRRREVEREIQQPESAEEGAAAEAAQGEESGEDAEEPGAGGPTAEAGEAPAAAAAPQKVKVKVEGHEIEVPVSEVVARAQKNWAADLRLQEAAKRQRELDDRERKLAERETALTSGAEKRDGQPSGTAPAAGEDVERDLDEVVSSLFAGDDKKAKESLKKILNRRTPATGQPVNKSELVAAAVAELRREQQAERDVAYRKQLEKAVDVFNKDYPDLSADESWAAAWDAETAKLQRANPERDLVEIAREAGNNLRRKINGNGQGGTRLERKRQAGPALRGDGVRAETGHDEPAPKTRAQVIAGMRKARGQPTV